MATACADASTVPGGDGTGGGRTDHPTGASELVLRISGEGGFVPVKYLMGAIPAFSLLGDGTSVSAGAQTAIYPGPALPPLIATPLTEAGVQALLRSAIEAGLGRDREYTDLGSMGVADAFTTVFTLNLDGDTHVTKVYALGMLGGERPAGMSNDEFLARTRLEAFRTWIEDLPGHPPRGLRGRGRSLHACGPAALRERLPGPGRSRATRRRVAAAVPLSSFGDPAVVDGYACGTVTGADLEAVLPLAEAANLLTPWTNDGTKHSILFRPLLPDESGC